MIDIIQKLGMKPITADYSAKVWGQTEDVVKLITVKKLEQQRNEMLEALAIIIKIQNDPRESLSNLNSSIRNAENMLIDKFPKIKELL